MGVLSHSRIDVVLEEEFADLVEGNEEGVQCHCLVEMPFFEDESNTVFTLDIQQEPSIVEDDEDDEWADTGSGNGEN